jgi:malonyl CoA-acyl carrier protein transacylase
MVAFVFPGQGSQRKGMGNGLFDEVREFSGVEHEVNAILGYSVRELCLEDPGKKLTETQYTQPCLYVVNAYYKALSQGVRPQYVAGHSLGEYNALLAAGVFDFLTGLRLVKKRGELMAQATGGGMAAVAGLRAEQVARIRLEHGLFDLDVANFNSPTQTVLSGPVGDIQRARESFEAAGATLYMPLPVSAAFHSRYMVDAARLYADFLASASFSRPRLPVIANATALPYADESNAVRSLLAKQITHPVQWRQSVSYLISQGVVEFKEIGPGNVLTRLVQQIQQQIQKDLRPASATSRGQTGS